MGGPIAIFRWDNIDDMDIKDFSIREIQDPPVADYSSFNTSAIYILTDILVVIVILMIYLAVSNLDRINISEQNVNNDVSNTIENPVLTAMIKQRCSTII